MRSCFFCICNLVDFTDISVLKERNNEAIELAVSVDVSDCTAAAPLPALSNRTFSGEQPAENMTMSSDVSVLTDVGGDLGGFEDVDGAEQMTVHTAKTPTAILLEEQKLCNYLADLNVPKKKIITRELRVGGHLINVQTFHYPALNSEAPRNKKQRTYIDPKDLPAIFAYEFKAALTIRIQQVTMFS